MGSVPGSGAHTERLTSRPRHAFRTNGFRAPSILAGSTLAVLGVAGIMQRPHALAVPALGLAICGAVLVGLGVPRRRHPDHTGAAPGPITEDGTAVSLLVHQQGGKTTLRYLEFRSPGVPPTSGTAAHEQEAEEVELRSPVRWRGRLYLVIGLATGAITAWDTLTAIDLADRVAAALRLAAAAGACWAGWLLLRATASRWSGIGGGMASLFIVSEYWRLAFADRWIDWRATVALFVASLVLLAVVVAVVVSWLCERWVNPVPGQRVLAVRIEVGLAVLALVGTLFAAVLQIGGGWYTSTHNPAQSTRT
jgi:hypothetical protein